LIQNLTNEKNDLENINKKQNQEFQAFENMVVYINSSIKGIFVKILIQ
jgi:hypothetical protein